MQHPQQTASAYADSRLYGPAQPSPGYSASNVGASTSASSSSNSLSQPAPANGSSTPERRPNPLTDLIDTERIYVANLASIIKRVAAAWSRSNFPPKALDTIFRAIEAVFRINKVLLAKLEDIGPNPASPKALGDLLMRWVRLALLDLGIIRVLSIALRRSMIWNRRISSTRTPTALLSINTNLSNRTKSFIQS